MKSTYRLLAYLVAGGVLVQAAAVAYAWFTVINDIDEGGVFDKNAANAGHYVHGVAGMAVIPLIALAFLIVSFFAKVPGGLRWAGATFGLTALQVGLAVAGFDAPLMGALHGVNALVLLAVSFLAGYRMKSTVSGGNQAVALAGAARS